MKTQKWPLAGKALVAAAFSIASMQAVAADAVSATNGKLEAIVGHVNGDEVKAAEGSLSIPVSKRFGVQLDGLIGDMNTDNVHGVGLHAFWRNPAKGLVGVTTSHVENDGFSMERTGVEAEYYLPTLTFSGEAGKQRGDVPNAEYGRAGLTWYPHDNLAVDAYLSKSDQLDKQHVGVEYQTKVKGLALFADVANGDDSYDHVLAGVTYYFGGKKTLKQRHREDDPRNRLFDSLTDLGIHTGTFTGSTIGDGTSDEDSGTDDGTDDGDDTTNGGNNNQNQNNNQNNNQNSNQNQNGG